MHQTVSAALRSLSIKRTHLYYAGSPAYRRNFSRDGLIYGLLAGDVQALLAQIAYSAAHQGKTSNPVTGEELGKVHHEMPSGEWRGRPTAYNACDTTPLYLMALGKLISNGHRELLNEYKQSIDAAINYILTHLQDNLFTEDPRHCGAKSFASRVTYWKDSILNGPYEEPKYPIVYSLVHFQAADALQIIGKVLAAEDVVRQGNIMKKVGMDKLWIGDHFATAVDQGTHIIDAPSSDSLHSLLYINSSEISEEQVALIESYSLQLECVAGFMPAIVQTTNPDVYHLSYLWVFEQAMLSAAARKHSLRHPAHVAERVIGFMDGGFPELLSEDTFVAVGNPLQLWSVGAYCYFKNPSNSLF